MFFRMDWAGMDGYADRFLERGGAIANFSPSQKPKLTSLTPGGGGVISQLECDFRPGVSTVEETEPRAFNSSH